MPPACHVAPFQLLTHLLSQKSCWTACESFTYLFAQGFLAVAAASNILFFLLFKLGKRLSAPLLRWRDAKAKAD